MLDILSPLFVRELRTLRREVEAYPDESQLWMLTPGISNSGGQLAHHLTGNLRHYIGAVLGGTDYVRDRDGEFARTDLTREELLQRIDDAMSEVERALASLDPVRLSADYPQPVGGHHLPVAAFLAHLLAHFAYHLGQIDFHRRMITAHNVTVDAVATAGIPGARR